MRKKPSASVDLDELVEEARENIKNDRSAAHTLLINVMKQIMACPEKSHEDLGFVAAKYLENLSRGNEQLLKLLATLSSKTTLTGGSGNIAAEVKDDIFDTLQEEAIKDVEESKKKKEE